MSQTLTIPPLESMICFSVYSAGLAFNRLYRGLLERCGLTYPQFLVLVALRQQNNRKVSDLGEALFLESNTLTPLLKRMELAGLIARRRASKDERAVIVSLTEKGARLTLDLGCVPPDVAQATRLDLGEITALTARLNTLSKALREHVAH